MEIEFASFPEFLDWLRKKQTEDPEYYDGIERIEIENLTVTEASVRCPRCGSMMIRNGCARRTVIVCGICCVFQVPVYICRACAKRRKETGNEGIQYGHRGLPDGIHPNMCTPADVLYTYAVLCDQKQADPEGKPSEMMRKRWQELDPACDERTLGRWNVMLEKLKKLLIAQLMRFAELENNPVLKALAESLVPGRMTSELLAAAVRRVLKKTGRLSNDCFCMSAS